MEISFDENIFLVKKICQRFRGVMIYDDIYQAGLMGLYQAINLFDETKGFKFSTFASKYILYSIRREIRESQQFHLPRKLIKIITYINKLDNYHVEDVANKLGVNKEDVLSAMTYQFISRFDETIYTGEKYYFDDLIYSLNAEEKNMMILKFKYNLTQYDIALLLNKSQTYVSKTLKRILENIKKETFES